MSINDWLNQPIPCDTFFSADGDRFATMPRWRVWYSDAEPFIGPIVVFAAIVALLAFTR